MARLPRYAAPGIAQHIIQRGNNRVAIFAAKSDYRFYLECLVAASNEHGCRVHAYVMMTNHVHVLATPSSASTIPLVMQDVGRRYVRRFNDTYGRSGTLWEGRYRATLVETEQYFLTCQRYVELNPVRAGLATHAVDYPWSSYRFNAHSGRDALVSAHDSYLALGATPVERRRAYRAICADPVPDSMLAEIRDATNRRWALGTKAFRDECAKLLGRRVEPSSRGRRPRHVAGRSTQQKDEIRI
jgi:putative transposase